MRGRVVDYNFQTSSGVISGSDGGRYPFYRTEWRKPEEPARGTVVDFVVSDGVAKSVYPLQGSDATLPGRPVPPRPNTGQGQARPQSGAAPGAGAYGGASGGAQRSSGSGMGEVASAILFAVIGAVIGVFAGLGVAILLAFFLFVAFDASEDAAGGVGILAWIAVVLFGTAAGAYFGVKRAGRPNRGAAGGQMP